MSLSWIVIGLFVAFIALNVVLGQVAARRAKALRGKPLPALPGELGRRISSAPRALVYFFTPSCAACRPITPRMKDLAEHGSPVFPVDASRDPELAMALRVMATPTTLEVQDGKVINAYVGGLLPGALWDRFAH
ncbi:MAG: thioredoxin family protein [Myxococcaceae bacterium]